MFNPLPLGQYVKNSNPSLPFDDLNLGEEEKRNFTYLHKVNLALSSNASVHWSAWNKKYQKYYLDICKKTHMSSLTEGQKRFVSQMANEIFSYEKVFKNFNSRAFPGWFSDNAEQCQERWEACIRYYNYVVGNGNRLAAWSLNISFPEGFTVFQKTVGYNTDIKEFYFRPPDNYSVFLAICYNKWANKVWRIYTTPPKFEEGQIVRVYRPNNFIKNERYFKNQDKTKITSEDVVILENKGQSIQSISRGSRPYLVISPKTQKRFVVKEKYLYEAKDICP